MFYFARKLVLFLIIFVVLSITIQQGIRYFYADGVGDTNTAFVKMTRKMTQIQDTESGLLLAGMAAQNRRDWKSAGQFFSTFNDKYHNNPQIALKAMTLALGNGEYDKVRELAIEINGLDAVKYPEIESESFDLARLFLLLDALKNKNFKAIEALKPKLDDGILSQFSVPILDDWITATNAPDTINANVKDLSIIQIYYKALAAEFAGHANIAKSLMSDVQSDTIAPNKIMDMVAFYMRLGDGETAKKIIENAAELYKEHYNIQATLKTLRNNPDSYEPPYKADFHMQGASSALSLAFHDFAILMLNEGAVDSALLFARLAAHLDEQSPSVFATIGSIAYAQGQEEKALTNFAKVSDRDSEFESSMAKMIDILVEQKRLNEAESIILNRIERPALDNRGNAYFYYMLGNVYKEQNDFDAAIDAYDAAESLGKHDGELPRKLWPLYYSRAIAFDLSDKWPEAEADLMTAMQKFPDNPLILNYLGYAYADRKINLEKAKDMISRAVLMVPNDAYIIDSMGWIYYRTGDYADAVKYLERAAMLEPYHMVINDHLGDAYWKVGRKLEAKYMWQRAIDYYKEGDEEQDRMIEDTRRKVVEGL